jgi:cytochrome c biogenesis factor
MNLLNYNIFILVAIFLLFAGMMLFIIPFKKDLKNIGLITALVGPIILIVFLCLFWIKIKQPALRSVYETFIWWSILLIFLGYFVFLIWKFKWFLIVSLFISIGLLTFLFIYKASPYLYFNPLFQSKWILPHALTYILAYVILTGAFIFNIITIYNSFQIKDIPKYLQHTDLFVNIGFVLITFGLVFGALWAKDSWGHYWTWDIKECWALLTWLLYLIYIHLRYYQPMKYKINIWVSIIAYISLLMGWVGISLLKININSLHNFWQ